MQWGFDLHLKKRDRGDADAQTLVKVMSGIPAAVNGMVTFIASHRLLVRSRPSFPVRVVNMISRLL